MPAVSAIVCTYCREAYLDRCLESLLRQTLPPVEFEIVVVDNAGSEATRTVVDGARGRSGGVQVRYMNEPRVGLGYARNSGAEAATGRYVAFIDDDAVAAVDWLEHALAAFTSVGPTPLVVGGPILPRYEVTPPDWFLDKYELRTWGETARFLGPTDTFAGSNMILDREVFAICGGFDVRVGARGGNVGLGEETALLARVGAIRPGAALYYSPDVKVEHAVPARRLTVHYQLERALVYGQERRIQVEPGALRQFEWLARDLARALVSLPRHRRWQQWATEDLAPLAADLGGLRATLGIRRQMSRD